MLSISDSQMAGLADSRAQQLAERLAARARQRHGARLDHLSAPTLCAAMRQEVDHARAAGYLGRADLERWADLACGLGFGFSTELPWAREVLANDRRPAHRLRELEERAAFAVRRGV